MSTLFRVGQPYPGRIPPSDGPYAAVTDSGGLMLLLFLTRPQRQEVREVTKGRLDISLYAEGVGAWLLYRFGSAFTLGTSMNILIEREDRRRRLLYGDGDVPVQVVLVERPAGIVRGLRLVSVDGRGLRRALIHQEQWSDSPDQIAATIADIEARKDDEQMIRDGIVIATHRGR